jgi:hypothetical protein
MHVRLLIPVGLLLAASAALANALVTKESVGVVEYIVGFAVLILLLLSAFGVSRRALR